MSQPRSYRALFRVVHIFAKLAEKNVFKEGATPGHMAPPLGNLRSDDTRYIELRNHLSSRAKSYRRLSYVFLVLAGVTVIAAGAFTFWSGPQFITQVIPITFNNGVVNQIELEETAQKIELTKSALEAFNTSQSMRRLIVGDSIWVSGAGGPFQPTEEITWLDEQGKASLAVGNDEAFYTTDGLRWLPEAFDNDAFQPNSTGFMRSASQQWIAGKAGLIAELDPDLSSRKWKTQQIVDESGHPISSKVASIFMTSSSEGWAVGESGLIARRIKGQWTKIKPPSPTSENLIQVAFSSDGYGFIVGYNKTIYYRSPGETTVWEKASVQNVQDGIGFKRIYLDPHHTFERGGVFLAVGDKGTIVAARFKDNKVFFNRSYVKRGRAGVIEVPLTLRYVERLASTSQYVAVGDSGTIVFSDNGGDYWTKIDPRGFKCNLYFAQSVDANHVRVAGAGEFIGALDFTDRLAPAYIAEHLDQPLKSGAEASCSGKSIYQLSIDEVNKIAVGSTVLVSERKIGQLSSLPTIAPKTDSVPIVDGLRPIVQEDWGSTLFNAHKDSKEIAFLKTQQEVMKGQLRRFSEIEKQVGNLEASKASTYSQSALSSAVALGWAAVGRAILALFLFFIIRYIVKLSQHFQNYAAFYESRLDALEAAFLLPCSVEAVGAWLLPPMLDSDSVPSVDSYAQSLKVASSGTSA